MDLASEAVKKGCCLRTAMPNDGDARIVRLTRPVVLDFGNGTRLRVEALTGPSEAAGRGGRRGRKPGPSTQKLISVMEADKEAGRPRSHVEYIEVLRNAGGPASLGAAGQVVRREATRIFGRPLGRAAKPSSQGGSRGRPVSPTTLALREKMDKDKAAGKLGDAAHYADWLVKHHEVSGLKQARSMVYRELRARKA